VESAHSYQPPGKEQERRLFFPHKNPQPSLSVENTKFLKFQDLTRRDMLIYMLRHKQFSETVVEKKNS